MQHASVALVLLAVSVAVLVPLLGVANKEALKGSTICSANEEKVFLRSALLYLFLAVVFFTMFLKSRRFIELFPPFAILSFAWSIECYLRTSTVTRPRLDTTRVGAFALWVIPLLLGVLAYSSIQSASAQVKTSPRYGRFQAAGNWLRLNAEPGSLVVNADWDDFPRLFHFNSANTYFAGLDPYFSYVQDPQLFLAWREFGRGNFRGDVAELVRDRIGGRYVFLDDRHAKLGSQLAVDPRFTKVFSSNDSTIFEVSKDIR